MEIKEQLLKYSKYLHFENFQLLVEQTSIGLVYPYVIKLDCVKLLRSVVPGGCQRRTFFGFPPTYGTRTFK